MSPDVRGGLPLGGAAVCQLNEQGDIDIQVSLSSTSLGLQTLCSPSEMAILRTRLADDRMAYVLYILIFQDWPLPCWWVMPMTVWARMKTALIEEALLSRSAESASES